MILFDENVMDEMLDYICENYCNCEKCKADDTPCYLEEDLKEILRKKVKDYLN